MSKDLSNSTVEVEEVKTSVDQYKSGLAIGEDGVLRKYHSPFIKGSDDETRMIEFVISDDTIDRHQEVIPITAWKLDNYKKNNIVKFMHLTGSRPVMTNPLEGVHLTIGKADLYIDGNQLIAKVYFEPEDINPLADTIYKKLKWGSLKATSVGFIWLKGHWGVQEDNEDTGTYYYDLVELTELSIVDIPANPNAVMKSLAAQRKSWIDKQHSDKSDEATPDKGSVISKDTSTEETSKVDTGVAAAVAQAHINISKSLNY